MHIAFSVGSKEKVDELTERLRADGYEVVRSLILMIDLAVRLIV